MTALNVEHWARQNSPFWSNFTVHKRLVIIVASFPLSPKTKLSFSSGRQRMRRALGRWVSNDISLSGFPRWIATIGLPGGHQI
jgi:hypothetical protein